MSSYSFKALYLRSQASFAAELEADLAGASSCVFSTCCVFGTHAYLPRAFYRSTLYSTYRYICTSFTRGFQRHVVSHVLPPEGCSAHAVSVFSTCFQVNDSHVIRSGALSTRRRRAPSSGTSGWRWCWSSWTSPWCPRDRETLKNRVVLLLITDFQKLSLNLFW